MANRPLTRTEWMAALAEAVDNFDWSGAGEKRWIGLTDEDREDILRWIEWKEVGSQPVAPQKLIAYVERKLREKNT